MQFEFATATRILFGPGTLRQVGKLAAEMGRRAFLAIGAGTAEPAQSELATGRAAPLIENLHQAGLETVLFPIRGEPTVDLIRSGIDLAREAGCDLVIGFGGGSAVDSGKAIAALLTNPGELLDYLEVVGKGQKITQVPVPVIAIPTTAGTGAEVTRNAVLGVPEHQVKASLRSPLMLPRLALVDPELTLGLPREVTASTGLDALTQLIEPYVSNQANPITDALCREGISRVARSLLRAFENGNNLQAREDMSLASLLGGLALANAKLGAVHGIAAPLGGMFDAPHGALCGRLLPYVMETNVWALWARDRNGVALRRYNEIGQILNQDPQATASDAVSWVYRLSEKLNVPPLSAYGVTEGDFAELIEKASQASSMKGNPIQLTERELVEILSRAL